jgi:predicted amidohydrolase YtcJ
MTHKLSVSLLIFVSGAFVSAQPRPAATLMIINATIFAVDKQHPKAEAMAAIGDRIVAVGSRVEIDLWRGPQTQVIDAGGKLLLPGFNDSHVHFINGGAQLDRVDLKNAETPQEFAQRIAAQVSKTEKGEWILGGDWDETKWPKPELPTKELIDTETGDTPIFVNRYDGHESCGQRELPPFASSQRMPLSGRRLLRVAAYGVTSRPSAYCKVH